MDNSSFPGISLVLPAPASLIFLGSVTASVLAFRPKIGVRQFKTGPPDCQTPRTTQKEFLERARKRNLCWTADASLRLSKGFLGVTKSPGLVTVA
ncbi:hypothetical protein C8J56DRAFT_462632 [Mycena floridula]|nr:hypothetical protein C8J56DRAFT_462632 [Mycena floridula]